MSPWQHETIDGVSRRLDADERPEDVLRVRPQRPAAAFLSQLIAERMHLPPQRERRRETAVVAASCYAEAAAHAIRRLPPGFRKSVSA